MSLSGERGTPAISRFVQQSHMYAKLKDKRPLFPQREKS